MTGRIDAFITAIETLPALDVGKVSAVEQLELHRRPPGYE
jgi:hypothetical protein